MAKKPTRPVSAAQPVAEVAAPAQPVAEQVQETQETPPVSEAPVSLIHHVSFESDKATAYSIALSIARNRKLAVVLRDETGNEMRIDAPSAKAPRAQPIAVDTGERPATLMEAGSLSKIALAPVKVTKPPTAQQERVIALCIREEGATTKDLYTTTSSVQGVPWKDIVANCAKRFGYVMTVAQDANGRTVYKLRAHSVSAPAQVA